ncbi:MAG: tetratricopeptide repeat protein [Planctomycetia bacterium]
MSSEPSLNEPLLKARQLLRSRQYEDAVRLLQNLPEDDAASEEAISLLGMAHYFSKDFESAVKVFESLTRQFPLSTGGWVNLGAALNRLGEFRRAVDALRRAVQRDRRCADAWYNLGLAQRGMNMTTMAISAYKEALKLNPRMADAHINLGRIYADSGNLSQAQKSFLEVLKIDPASKKAQMLLESVQVSLKASKKTESPFGRLVDIEELDRRLVNSARRGLSVGQRQQERELVQAVTKKMRQDAKDLVPLLEESLHTQLHRLERIVLDTESRMQSDESIAAFSVSLSELRQRMAVITTSLDEIRAYLSP